MKHLKTLFYTIGLIFICSSCSSTKEYIPLALSSVNTVKLADLNLERDDYEIHNTISATATISIKDKRHGDKIVIQEESGEFVSTKTVTRREIKRELKGVLRAGFLSNDYIGSGYIDYTDPVELSRIIAIYRIIGLAQLNGADGIIEPIISTDIDIAGNFTTKVSAKLLILKVD